MNPCELGAWMEILKVVQHNTCVCSMRWKEREGHNPAKKKLEEAR